LSGAKVVWEKRRKSCARVQKRCSSKTQQSCVAALARLDWTLKSCGSFVRRLHLLSPATDRPRLIFGLGSRSGFIYIFRVVSYSL
jgi:hypothetical protein